MTDHDRIFRQEALDELSARPGPRALIRMSPRPALWLYRAVVALALAGAVAGFTVRVDTETTGPGGAVVTRSERLVDVLLRSLDGE